MIRALDRIGELLAQRDALLGELETEATKLRERLAEIETARRTLLGGRVPAGTSAAGPTRGARATVLAWLRDNPGQHTPEDVAKGTAIEPAQARSALLGLHGDGHVARPAREARRQGAGRKS